jgi:hypothetical protein
MEGIQAFAKQALAGASAAMLFTSSMEAAVAYPIFAQQNYANPREYTGKIVCANCHLASKPIEVRLPQAVLPDTIFKMEVEVPAKYAKRRQPLADGSKGPMNIGAVTYGNVGNCIQVAGLGCPNLLLEYTNCWPQVYPEGNQSNNNQFLASATATISAIDGLKVPRLHSWHPGWRGVPILISFTVQ